MVSLEFLRKVLDIFDTFGYIADDRAVFLQLSCRANDVMVVDDVLHRAIHVVLHVTVLYQKSNFALHPVAVFNVRMLFYVS